MERESPTIHDKFPCFDQKGIGKQTPAAAAAVKLRRFKDGLIKKEERALLLKVASDCVISSIGACILHI